MTPPLASPKVAGQRSKVIEVLNSLGVDEVAKQIILREIAAQHISAVAWLAMFQELLRYRRPHSMAAYAIHFARNPVIYEGRELKAGGLYGQIYREFDPDVD